MSNSKIILKNKRKGSQLPSNNSQIENNYLLNPKAIPIPKNNSQKTITGYTKRLDKCDVDCTFLDLPKIQKRTLKIIGNHDFYQTANIQSNKTIKANMAEQKTYIDASSETNKKIQMLTSNRSIIIEKDRVSMELRFFKSLLDELNHKMNKLQQQNNRLKDLQNRFQTYLSSMKEDIIQDFEQNSHSQKEYRMKILQLQNKIQTLNYIIKQYRNSNKEEIKNFEKKLSQYKPNIQAQLARKLKEVTENYICLENQMKYLRGQCKIESSNFNWDVLVTNYVQQLENIQKYQNCNAQQKIQIQNLRLQIQNLRKLQHQFQKKQQGLEQNIKKIKGLKDTVGEYQQQIKKNQIKIGEYQNIIEQLQFKLEEVNTMKNTLKIKEEILKSNKIYITKLQSQNLTLKEKIRCFILKDQEKYQQQPINVIVKNLQNIDLYNQRFNQCVKNFNDQEKQEKLAFICHLILKINYCYEEIIHNYIQQIQLYQCQNNDLKLISEKNLDYNIKGKQWIQSIYDNLKEIMDKFQRCVISSKFINTNNSCCQCNHWIAHFGQLSNLLTINFQKLTQAKSSLPI